MLAGAEVHTATGGAPASWLGLSRLGVSRWGRGGFAGGAEGTDLIFLGPSGMGSLSGAERHARLYGGADTLVAGAPCLHHGLIGIQALLVLYGPRPRVHSMSAPFCAASMP